MQKRVLASLLVLCLLFSMNAFVWGSQPQIQVYLEEDRFTLSEDPYLNHDAKLMLPLREIAEAIGFEVEWQGEGQGVILNDGSTTLQLQIGEGSAQLNGQLLDLPAAPEIWQNRTFVPAGLLSVLDQIVGWDAPTQTVRIRSPKAVSEAYFTPSEDQALGEKLNAYLEALEKYKHFQGSVLVAQDDQLLLSQGYGYANEEQLTTNEAQTRFAVGSVTKQFTAMAIMQLQEQGKLKVEDVLSAYLPDFPHGDEITLHQLLTHTSGLVNYTDLLELYSLPAEAQTAAGVLALIQDEPLLFTPGARFVYNNTGYFALTLVIEQVTGEAYEDYLKINIFEPLNMEDTGILYGAENQIHDSTPYVGFLEVYPVDDAPLLKVAYGAGAMYSTVEDLYRWERALETEQLVKRETLDQIFTPYTEFPGLGHYAYGWVLTEGERGSIVFHTGGTLGFTANLVRYPDQDLTIIMLVNTQGFDVTSLADELEKIVAGEPYEMPRERKEIVMEDYDVYDEYVGIYQLWEGVTLTVTRTGNQLFAQITGQEALEIYAESETEFFYKIVDAQVAFVRDEAGQVATLKLSQAGMEYVAPRIGEPVVRTEISLEASVLEAYVGDYELYPGVNLTITLEGDQLFARMTGQDAFEIYAESETEFFYKVADAQITFVQDEAGQTVSLLFYQNQMEIPGTKID